MSNNPFRLHPLPRLKKSTSVYLIMQTGRKHQRLKVMRPPWPCLGFLANCRHPLYCYRTNARMDVPG